MPYPRAQGAFGFARLSNAGILDGLRDIRSRRRLEVVPFVAPQAGYDYLARGSTTDIDRYGVDARIGLTDTLTADLTYKTDFAQVEADQEVVNVSRFSLFFPEKRQFFTETRRALQLRASRAPRTATRARGCCRCSTRAASASPTTAARSRCSLADASPGKPARTASA